MFAVRTMAAAAAGAGAAPPRPALPLFDIPEAASDDQRFVLECRNAVIQQAAAGGAPVALEQRASRYQSKVLQIIEARITRSPPIDYAAIRKELRREQQRSGLTQLDASTAAKRARDKLAKRTAHKLRVQRHIASPSHSPIPRSPPLVEARATLTALLPKGAALAPPAAGANPAEAAAPAAVPLAGLRSRPSPPLRYRPVQPSPSPPPRAARGRKRARAVSASPSAAFDRTASKSPPPRRSRISAPVERGFAGSALTGFSVASVNAAQRR